MIVAGRVARTPKGIEHLVELADILQARVQDQRMRMNFPSAHPLYGHPGAGIATPNLSDHDVILALEAQDLWGITHKMTGFNKFGMESQPTIKAGATVITVSAIALNHKSNYQRFGHEGSDVALAITGDPEATLPELIEAVKKLITADRRRAEEREIAAENQAKAARRSRTCRPRMGREPHHRAPFRGDLEQVKNEDWSLVSNDRFVSS